MDQTAIIPRRTLASRAMRRVSKRASEGYAAFQARSTSFYMLLFFTSLIFIGIGLLVRLVGYDTAPPDSQITRTFFFTFFTTIGGCGMLLFFLFRFKVL